MIGRLIYDECDCLHCQRMRAAKITETKGFREELARLAKQPWAPPELREISAYTRHAHAVFMARQGSMWYQALKVIRTFGAAAWSSEMPDPDPPVRSPSQQG